MKLEAANNYEQLRVLIVGVLDKQAAELADECDKQVMEARVRERFEDQVSQLEPRVQDQLRRVFGALSASTCHPDAVIAVKDAFVQVRALPPLPRTPAHAPH